jgi:hypothetical protein
VIKNAASRRYRPRKNSIKTDTGNRSSLHFDKNLGILIREYLRGENFEPKRRLCITGFVFGKGAGKQQCALGLKSEENCLDTCRMRLYMGFVGVQPLDPLCTICVSIFTAFRVEELQFVLLAYRARGRNWIAFRLMISVMHFEKLSSQYSPVRSGSAQVLNSNLRTGTSSEPKYAAIPTLLRIELFACTLWLS